MSPVTYRFATTVDSVAIAQLVNDAYRPGGDPSWRHESGLLSGDRTSALQVKQLLTSPHGAILLKQRALDIVACVHLKKTGDDCWISMLAVTPDCQGNGTGGQMLALAERHAVSAFLAKRLLVVVISERKELIAYYGRRGYRRTGSAEDYPLLAGTGTPRYPGLKIETLAKFTADVR
jgi:ribosomal protein S18 acetylase RimI-like enzyme